MLGMPRGRHLLIRLPWVLVDNKKAKTNRRGKERLKSTINRHMEPKTPGDFRDFESQLIMTTFFGFV